MLDRSEGVVYESKIVSKTFSKGKMDTYYLKIGPWGRQSEVQQIKVTREQYELAGEGNTVEVIQRAGYLNMPWVVVRLKTHQRSVKGGR